MLLCYQHTYNVVINYITDGNKIFQVCYFCYLCYRQLYDKVRFGIFCYLFCYRCNVVIVKHTEKGNKLTLFFRRSVHF